MLIIGPLSVALIRDVALVLSPMETDKTNRDCSIPLLTPGPTSDDNDEKEENGGW